MGDAPPSQPTLLSLPGDVLALIAAKLESRSDRLHWECTCCTLLAAARAFGSSGTWWGLPRLTLCLDSPRGARRAGAFLAARRPTATTLRLIASEEELNESTALLPPTTAPTLPSPPLASLVELELANVLLDRPCWEAVLRHSQLTCLKVDACQFARRARHQQPVSALRALQRLEVCAGLDYDRQPIIPWPCLQLAGCSRLTCLVLRQLGAGSPPAGMSALTALQRCRIYRDYYSHAWGWPELSRLGQLTELEMEHCHLEALPPQLSGLTALQRLSLQRNKLLDTGWQHLAGLSALTWLDLSYLHITSLPPVLAQLTGLRSLVLSQCRHLNAAGRAWKPLQGHPAQPGFT